MSGSTDRYRMPPEWAPHQGTWLSWPHNRETWPGCLSEAEAALTQAVVALADGETVHINVLDAAHRAVVAARFAKTVAPERIRFHLIPTNDAWCRDHGAIFAFDSSGALVALDFRFNAWGEKYRPFDADDAAASTNGGRARRAHGAHRTRTRRRFDRRQRRGHRAYHRAVPAEPEPQPAMTRARHRSDARALSRRAATWSGSVTVSSATTPMATSTI